MARAPLLDRPTAAAPQRRPAAAAPAPPGHPVLALQRTIGNRATTQLIQRFDVGDAVWDIVKGPVWRIGDLGDIVWGPLGGAGTGFALRQAFDQVVASNRSA